LLLSRIEKADRRIGVISIEEGMKWVREELHRRWEERHGDEN
jgi:hypothetical protein